MFFWDNRFAIISVVIAFVVGYMVGCPDGLDIFFETGGGYDAKNENYLKRSLSNGQMEKFSR
jgi:hypothetical protein